MAKEKLPLKTLTGIPFRINIDILKEIEEELELFLLEEDFMNTRDFSKKVMFNQEIKANNTVEGYNDSVSFIKKVIENDANNVRFTWLTNTKASLRFMSAPFNKRDFFK